MDDFTIARVTRRLLDHTGDDAFVLIVDGKDGHIIRPPQITMDGAKSRIKAIQDVIEK